MTESQGYMLIGVLFYICGAIYKNEKIPCISMTYAGIGFFVLSWFFK